MPFGLPWEIPITAMLRVHSQVAAAKSTGMGAAITRLRPLMPQPFNVFLNTRGAQFTTPGTGGFVQAPPGPVTGGDGGFELVFGNPTLGETFGVFSELRLFSPIRSNITDGLFFIPGTNGAQPATVRGFGAIFTDVDLSNSTSIEFFDAHNNSIFSQAVLPGTVDDKSLSFLGAVGSEEIFRVRITSGNTPIGSSADNPAKGVDLVAMDDFIYAEPRSVPESGVGIGLMGLVLCFVLFCAPPLAGSMLKVPSGER